MKKIQISTKSTILIYFGLIAGLVILVPTFLNFMTKSQRIQTISFLGNFFILIIIIITMLDLMCLIALKSNFTILSILNMSFSISIFMLLEYCFITGLYDFAYVWNYSSSDTPLVYKIVGIWAGEAGSIMTWMVFNSIFISFYRVKNKDQDDLVFLRSVIFSLIVVFVFLIILYELRPFKVSEPLFFPNGRGLNPILHSPYMIWHPFFMFLSYAIFLVPFSITLAEIITPNSKLKNFYQRDFFDFSLKFGWFVLTLGIGIGAYWASIALSWGRYWGWDPVETVSLLPWIFCTAYFHSSVFKKRNVMLVKVNVILIFISIVFATLITRGGGLASLHAFTGDTDLIFWVTIFGLILMICSIYLIYDVLNYALEEYKKVKLFMDSLSYFFLLILAYICILGLLLPPLTFTLSNTIGGNVIFVGPNYYIIAGLIPAIGLAILLIFCSLWKVYELKRIGVIIIIGIIVQLVITLVLFFAFGIFVNPLIIIFILALITSVFKLIRDFNIRSGLKQFFRVNSKTIIHIGISFILAGLVSDPDIYLLQDIFYFSGFFCLVAGITPSMLMVFFKKKNNNVTKINNQE